MNQLNKKGGISAPKMKHNKQVMIDKDNIKLNTNKMIVTGVIVKKEKLKKPVKKIVLEIYDGKKDNFIVQARHDLEKIDAFYEVGDLVRIESRNEKFKHANNIILEKIKKL